jgi:competence protein ComEC
MRTLKIVFVTMAAAVFVSAQARTLDIYWIDVEGGASPLIIAPSGESLLVDTGFPGNEDRDAKRIQAAAVAAGLTRIDNLVITHFHVDHVGGVPALSKLMPIGKIWDHGESI